MSKKLTHLETTVKAKEMLIENQALRLLLKANENPKTQIHKTAQSPFLAMAKKHYEVDVSDWSARHIVRLDNFEAINLILSDHQYLTQQSVEKVQQAQEADSADKPLYSSAELSAMSADELWKAAAEESEV